MKFLFTSVALTSVLLAHSGECVPRARDTSSGSTPTEVDILNFALTLEHLENAFYTQGLQKYSQQDFLDENLPAWARGRWSQIAQHESTHVTFLEGALGDQAVQPCTYNFPDTDAKSFAAVSFLLETVGVSAYSGAAKYLSADTVTAAAAILAVESRHSAWVNSAVLKENPWNTAFDTPLDLNQIYTLASSVITSCPSTNMALPVKAFPALTFPAGAAPGQTVQFTYNATSPSGTQCIAFLSGLNSTIVPIGSNNTITIPSNLQGVVFAIVTTSNSTVTDADTVAGPAFLSFDFGSSAQA
ncbi:hypothetical protein HYDPIDRAFT_31909 [Hydnomerulius pinastri MD-312]|uniref:Protein rds1 n=1 Tax=Hydnomerulius pinastri MD-312 TaxID=994086 RepID=A0A0C9WBI3_9AGAM|nr:hypothetical protein HYDPIDRAFT_31909 [Hydnomerulius pinastri MD-312]